MTAVLELHGVTCSFTDGDDTIRALDRVSLNVNRGELVAVMGPSGSGKSTLVHVCCGLVSPTSGRVRVLGDDMPHLRPERRALGHSRRSASRRRWADLRRRAIGVVHQRLNLVPATTAIENVALPLRLDGAPRQQAFAAASDALAEVDGTDLTDTRVERLSTGQQQRIALARAIVGQRQLLLADEPTAALDTVGAEQIAQLLARLADAGRGVLMATHDSRLATWADRVIVLRDGRIVDAVGPPAADTTDSMAAQ